MIKYIKFFLLLTLFLNSAKDSFSQDPFFKKINIPGTASNFRIYSLCQDSRKVIWIGTSEGVFRFNGLNFEAIDLPGDLHRAQITAIAKLHNNGIIAGTRDGKLFEIVNDVVIKIKPDSFQINTAISAFAVGGDDQVWFSTLGQGIFVRTNGSFNHFTSVDGIGDDYVYDVFMDAEKKLWVGSDGGLSHSVIKIGNIKFQNLNSSNGLPDNIVRKISKGPGTTIGIGMEEGGFCVYDYSKEQFSQPGFFKEWNKGPVTGVTLLSEEFWIGTPKSGIVIKIRLFLFESFFCV